MSKPRRREYIVLAILLAVAFSLPAFMRDRTERAADALGPRIAAAARAGDILMFTTSTCPYCAQARNWLGRHAVAHTECNTDTEQACARRFAELGLRGVPAFQVRGQVQEGFSAPLVAAALGIAD